MEVFAGLSVVVLVLVALAIVIQTFALWLRTRGLPELLLALYLSCATVVGYPLAIAMSLIPASENFWIHIVAQVVMSAGWVSLLFFTLKVFRPNSGWARCVVAISLVLVALGVCGYVIEVTGESPRRPEEMAGITVAMSLPVATAYFWTAFESVGYYRRLKLRLSLGLSEVEVVNRMLLWGIMTLAAGFALIINMAALLAGSYMSPPVVLISSILGLAHATCLLLAFNPPRWYRGWLERGAPVGSA